jgi:hypothetical protein
MRLFLYLTLTAVVLATEPTVESHDYLETTDGKQHTFRWTLTRGAKECRLQNTAKNELHTVLCTPDGTTRQWTLERPDTEVVCTRHGKTVTVVGTVDDKPYKREHKLGDTPWVQPLSLALRVLVAEKRKELVFWMLRPDNLGMVKLKATYDGTETVQIGKGKLAADRVRVSSAGVFGTMWHSFYWFRRSDHVFVRYEGIMGLPLLPKTTVVLRPAAKE